MGVTDEEIGAYRKKREQIEEDVPEEKEMNKSIEDEIIQLQKRKQKAKEKLKLE